MTTGNTSMDMTIIYDVDYARDIRGFILNNDDITYSAKDTKDKIMKANDNDILRIGKVIGSPVKIVSVDILSPDFFRTHLFKKSN